MYLMCWLVFCYTTYGCVSVNQAPITFKDPRHNVNNGLCFYCIFGKVKLKTENKNYVFPSFVAEQQLMLTAGPAMMGAPAAAPSPTPPYGASYGPGMAGPVPQYGYSM